MVFWGAEVKPGEDFTHSEENGDYEGSKLHLSQATLGLDGKGKERTVVKCKVGDGPELLLCSLTPGVSESCSLDLLFDQDVVFSVTGSTSVHLVGYYMPLEIEEDDDDDDEDYDVFNDSEDDEDEDYDEEDSDLDVPPSTSVKIEEIEDDDTTVQTPRLLLAGSKEETPIKESKKAAKKRKKLESAVAGKEETNVSATEVQKGVVEEKNEDSEDEDGFALPSKKKQALNGSDDTPASTSKQSKKQKKGKKDNTSTPAGKGEKSTDKKPNKAVKENGAGEKTPEKKSSANDAVASLGSDAKKKNGKKGSPAVRKFANGLEIEEIAMGKPDARQAKLGKRVSVNYTGKLKSSGKVFDSNVGKKAFSFRLGVGEVIKGWDVALAGMRIGDKRRITIPPPMAYGAKGVPGSIPGNSWLVFEVELTDAAK